MEAQRDTQPEIFMFINSSSGGGIGQELVALNSQKMALKVPASQFPADKQNLVDVNLYMFDLKNNEKRNSGFNLLKEMVDQNRKVIMVICGGDGTVMWVTSQLHDHDIDHIKVPTAMLPLGTGNDFSRVLGWGKECPPDLLDDDLAKLKKRVTYWLSAQEQKLDIWMVTAKTQQYGYFQKVANKKNLKMQEKILTKHFCNYFSIGIDGKVGYSFDLHRTSSRVGNMLVYGTMGLVKSFTKTKTIKDLTKSFKEDYLSIQLQPNNQGSARELDNSAKPILRQGDQTLEQVKNNQNLLFLNINSFMAGVTDIWKEATLPQALRNNNDFTNYQDSGDGRIQVISFGGVWSLGFEKSVGGFATKIYQGTGPFQFEFNQFPADGKHRTYMQIDGEFLRFTHPKSLMIQKSNLSKTGKIKILKRLPLQLQRGCCC